MQNNSAGERIGDLDQQADVSVYLRAKTSDTEMEQLVAGISAQPLSERRYLTREQLEEMRGARTEDMARVEQFAKAHGLAVVSSDAAARTIHLRGTLRALEAAFGVEFHAATIGNHTYRATSGPANIPPELADIVTSVMGLDARPVAHHGAV